MKTFGSLLFVLGLGVLIAWRVKPEWFRFGSKPQPPGIVLATCADAQRASENIINAMQIAGKGMRQPATADKVSALTTFRDVVNRESAVIRRALVPQTAGPVRLEMVQAAAELTASIDSFLAAGDAGAQQAMQRFLAALSRYTDADAKFAPICGATTGASTTSAPAPSAPR
jgi:hypothetical protein